MCQILVSFFEMGNVDNSLFVVEAFFIVDTLSFDLLNLISLCEQFLCIQNN